MTKDTCKVEIPDELRPVIAAAAKNLATHLYGPQGPPWGTSFASLEGLAVQISQQLGSELLRHALSRQADQSPPPELQLCPGCSGCLDVSDPEPSHLHNYKADRIRKPKEETRKETW